MKDSVVGPVYKRGTWTTIILIIFHELTGINSIMMFSTIMFRQMGSISPKAGSYYISVANLVGYVFALPAIRYIGRRWLLIGGHLAMALFHGLVGYCVVNQYNIEVVLFMVLFIMTYEIANGPVIWLYVSEVVVDSALGICIFTLYGTILVLSLTTNFLMSSALQPQGVFWLFGGITFIGAFFCFFFIRETRGLHDKEKKLIYSPRSYRAKLIAEADIQKNQ